jgi:CO/xanthine dehydrogenase FAD-binding subunit
VGCREDVLEIGAMTTLADLAADPLVAAHLPALRQAALLFGAPAIRSRATLGGNLATASPAADAPPPLLALDAVVVLSSRAGRREIPLASFFTSYRRTARDPGEMIESVRVPIPPAGTRQAFYKVGTRQAQSIAKAPLAGAARIDHGVVREIRLAAGSVAPTPILLRETAARILGRALTTAVVAEASGRAQQEVSPIDDVRSGEAYRRRVTGNLVARFLRSLL